MEAARYRFIEDVPEGVFVYIDDLEHRPRFSAEVVARLRSDLAAHPDSPTLQGLVERIRPDGAIADFYPDFDRLGHMYLRGASVDLVMETEHVMRLRGNSDAWWVRRGPLLARWMRSLNGQLAAFGGARFFDVEAVVGYRRRVLAFRDALAMALAVTARAVGLQVAGHAPPGTGWTPPPLESPSCANLLRTGPPSGRVRAAA